jgi:hypothetical protein
MAYVSDFTFNTMGRIGSDSCSQDINSIQNAQSCSYLLQNYFLSDCNMSKAKQLATNQPGIIYSGGMGSDMCGSNIDDSSKLLIGSIQTCPKARIDLFQRPFATVPFLGRGAVNPIMESQIQQGEQLVNKRSVNNLSEKSYIKYHQTPLLPAVKDRIDNSTKIESDASEGWIRGGVPSRELTRDNDYMNKHTTNQYI